MQHLDFILWIVLFPISVEICSYISAKKRAITKEEESFKGIKALYSLIILFVWVIVAKNLY